MFGGLTENLIPNDMLNDLRETKRDMANLVATLGRIEVLIAAQNVLLAKAIGDMR
jgi:hypothetical protein